MTEVVIRNKKFLETLNDISDSFYATPNYDKSEYLMRHGDLDGEYYCGEEHLRETMSNPHIGYPMHHYGAPITKMVKVDPEVWEGFQQRVKYDFAAEIGAHTSALLNYYPPGGFVEWHTNWNANAYQILFTHSVDGDGYFRYYDKKKDEIVHIQDVKGWQCRHYYFGREDEPDHHCWHSAYSGSQRITLAYKFANKSHDHEWNQGAIDARDDLIEMIESA